ncbi:MAG: DNA mismatch repair protein MutL, partial [Rikenellaceae bacterium]|nr:DNA mismatch repair protein MutL [Rikenellaceae bacterium]
MRNITQEFERIALCYPRISFFLYSDDERLYNLPAGNLRKRVLDITGRNVNNALLELYIESPLVEIRGYIGKPETAKKNSPRFMFVNGRYFYEPYLNKAIQQAYDKLLPSGSQLPPFFLYFTVDPASIDVNISPSKTQVKFDN